ncbi:MAG: arylsulfatase [Rikenellaceae bacterium]
MKKLLTTTATLTIAATLSAANVSKPNIVIIYADDLGFGDVSCYNPRSKIITPNIDALAQNGVRFTDAHPSSSISSPSRYGLLTGQYSWRTDVKRGNPEPGEELWISTDRLTIASLLDGVGYNTAAIGKWGLGANYSEAARSSREGIAFDPESIDYSKPIPAANAIGFDYEAIHHWYGREPYKKRYACHSVEGSAEMTDGARWYFENGMSQGGDPDFAKFDMEEAQMYYIHKTVEYIKAAGGEGENPNFNIEKDAPFFVYYAPHIPHYPHVPAKQFQGTSEVGLYGDFILQLDWAVGQIVEALEGIGQLDNTIIMFGSDNGPERQVFGYIEEYGHESMMDFRGVKRDIYQGGHTTPFIVTYPQSKSKGTVSDRLISLTDIFATIADIVDVSYDSKRFAEDSYSFADEILEGSKVENRREMAIHHSANGNLALRSGDWVFINAQQGNDTGEPEWFRERIGGAKNLGTPCELFNLKTDPKQTTNLINDYPEKGAELQRELLRYIFEGRSLF